MQIGKVAVIGAGTMGNGIAHVFALAGFEVTLLDVKQELVDRGLGAIKKNMERQVSKGIITQDSLDAALSKIHTALNFGDAKGADLAVEAVFENPQAKTTVFRDLDGILPPHAILASNTSSISITHLASATKRPEKVIGMHFMNPVPVLKLVELVRGLETSDETFQVIRELCLKLKKTPVEARDFPGFISNRILMPMINEACFALMEGVGSKEDIDAVMTLGMAHPLGPLSLADLIGLDVCLSIMETLHTGFGDSKYRPCPLLRKMVQAGRLGRKTGAGFYEYRTK